MPNLSHELIPRQGETAATAFTCQRCGNCCKGGGIVAISEAEAAAIAHELVMSAQAFASRHARTTEWDALILKDKFVGGEQWCEFLERDRDGLYACAINNAKPGQCRDFPMKWRALDAFRWCEGLKST